MHLLVLSRIPRKQIWGEMDIVRSLPNVPSGLQPPCPRLLGMPVAQRSHLSLSLQIILCWEKPAHSRSCTLPGTACTQWLVKVAYKYNPYPWNLEKLKKASVSVLPTGSTETFAKITLQFNFFLGTVLLPFLLIYRCKAWEYSLIKFLPAELRVGFPGNITATLQLPNWCFYLFLVLHIGVRNLRILSLNPSFIFTSENSKDWDYRRFHLGKHSESTSFNYKLRQFSVYKLISTKTRNWVIRYCPPSWNSLFLWLPRHEIFCLTSCLSDQSISCDFYSHLLMNSKLPKGMQKSVKTLIVIHSY